MIKLIKTLKKNYLMLKPTNPQFDPESVHMCTKLSGQAAQFSKKEKFDSIVRFLAARWVFPFERISF